MSITISNFLGRLIELLKPLYQWILNLLHSYWAWITTGSVSDVILKVAAIALLCLGVAWASSFIARLIQYIIYAVCTIFIIIGLIAVVAKLGFINISLHS